MTVLLHEMAKTLSSGERQKGPIDPIVPFNAVMIGCCCKSHDRERALQCVLEAMDLMGRTPEMTPNQSTYPLIFRAIKLNTIPGARRHSLVLRELENCSKHSRLCPESVAEVEDACPGLLAGYREGEPLPMENTAP